MTWKEVIYLLTTELKVKELMKHLPDELKSMMVADKLEAINILNNAIVTTSLVVELIWHGECDPQKSRLGFMLCERLAREGMTDHSIWITTGIENK